MVVGRETFPDLAVFFFLPQVAGLGCISTLARTVLGWFSSVEGVKLG